MRLYQLPGYKIDLDKVVAVGDMKDLGEGFIWTFTVHLALLPYPILIELWIDEGYYEWVSNHEVYDETSPHREEFMLTHKAKYERVRTELINKLAVL